MRIIVILAICFVACAPTKKIVKQAYPSPYEFQLIDTLSGSKSEIYVKSFEWISKSYGSAKSVVDMSDKEAGKIIGKAIMSVDHISGISGTVSYIISIDVKDGRYRCILSDFSHKGNDIVSKGAYARISRSYGDLGIEKFLIAPPEGGKKIEDKRYYALKNYVMTQAQDILLLLKTKMHSAATDF